MSASKLFTLLGASLLRHHHRRHLAANLFSPFPSVPCVKIFPSSTLRSPRFCSSAAVLEANTAPSVTATTSIDNADGNEPTVTSNSHPWSEWVAFVDKLKTKGYLNEKLAKASKENEDGVEGVDGLVYTDMNLLKDACLTFARDRYDIFKSMSRQEIQAVVDKGCPSILRKAVNSAKRLRGYLQLDEGDVCSGCVLRGSCDRAYLFLKGSEADAGTVDVVRILLLYALDPVVTSGGVKTSEREVIEASAKKLLSELIELSETPIGPALSMSAVKVSQKKQFVGSVGHGNSQNIEMKSGDWICHLCNFMNFARNVRCLKCYAEGPARVPTDHAVKKIGDWNCPQCKFMNFASNIKCLRCQTPRPQKHEGEWDCPACHFLNFKGNVVCKRCNHEAPKRLATEIDDQIWKKPF